MRFNKIIGRNINLKRKKLIGFFRWQVPWILYCLLIFYISSVSSPPGVVTFPYSDKIIHAFIYLLLAIVTLRGFCKWPGEIFRRYCFFWAMLFCILYGLSDEWHQSFVANRYSDVMDWIADVIGISIGGVLYRSYCKKTSKGGGQ